MMKWAVMFLVAALAFATGVYISPLLRTELVDLSNLPAELRDSHKDEAFLAQEVKNDQMNRELMEAARKKQDARKIGELPDDLPSFPFGILYRTPDSASWVSSDITGDDGRFSGSAGKWRIVNMWASWCAPCLQEMPDIERAQERLADAFLIFPLNVDAMGKDDLAKVEEIFSERKTPSFAPLVATGEARTAWLASFGASQYPSSMIFDPQDRPVAVFYGFPTDKEGDLWASDEMIDFLLALKARGSLSP